MFLTCYTFDTVILYDVNPEINESTLI